MRDVRDYHRVATDRVVRMRDYHRVADYHPVVTALNHYNHSFVCVCVCVCVCPSDLSLMAGFRRSVMMGIVVLNWLILPLDVSTISHCLSCYNTHTHTTPHTNNT